MANSTSEWFINGPKYDPLGSTLWIMTFCVKKEIKGKTKNETSYLPLICIDVKMDSLMEGYSNFKYQFSYESQVIIVNDEYQILNPRSSWGIDGSNYTINSPNIRCRTGISQIGRIHQLFKVNLCYFDETDIPKSSYFFLDINPFNLDSLVPDLSLFWD